MIKNILTIIFAFIAIAWTFTCFGRLFRKVSVNAPEIFLMAIGIVGTIACTLMKW